MSVLSLSAPIVAVTVLEDRAFVRRQGQLEVPAGRHRWQLEGWLSPVLVDKSLAVTLEGGARALGTQVVRRRTHRDTPPPPPSEAADHTVEGELVSQELESAERMLGELLYLISERVSLGDGALQAWEEQLEELMAWKEELLQRQLDLLAPPASHERKDGALFEHRSKVADLVGEVQAEGGGLLTFTIEYAVALACWRPYHQAEWTGSALRFTAEACVWQNTGEDWSEVELVLSTERQSLGATPPPLPRDTLSTRKRNGNGSLEVVVEERQVEIQESPSAAPEEIPGIDDGGQVFTTPVSCRCSIPSDGQAVKVPLFEFEAPARWENLLVAELQPQVVQLTALSNSSPHPILAGPVELLREGAWVGRARLGLVAPGEGFRLSWGSHPSLRARRETRQLAEVKDDLLGGWTRTRHEVSLTLSNLSAQSHKVEVVERIPVSEIRQVEVQPDLRSILPAVQPDGDGLVRWTVELGPRARQSVQSAYWLRKRREVVTATSV